MGQLTVSKTSVHMLHWEDFTDPSVEYLKLPENETDDIAGHVTLTRTRAANAKVVFNELN